MRSFNPLCGWKGITSAGCRTLYVRRIWRFFYPTCAGGTVPHIPLPGSVTASPRSRWKCDVSPSGASSRLIPWSCDKNTKWLGKHPPLTWQRDHSRAAGGSRSSSSSVQTVGEVWRGSGLHLLFPHSLCPWDARSVNTALPTFFPKQVRRTGYRCSIGPQVVGRVPPGGGGHYSGEQGRDCHWGRWGHVIIIMAVYWHYGGYLARYVGL